MKWVLQRLVVVPLLWGCSTTSTIYRASGPPVEADIVGGSRSSLVIEANGRRDVISRSDVTEIDYPGNVHAVTGGILLGYGVVNVALGMERCSEGEGSTQAEETGFCVGLFTPAVLGLGMMIWGLVVNGNQKSAVKDHSMDVEAPAPPPPAWPAAPPPQPPPAPPPAPAPTAPPAPVAPEAPPPASTTEPGSPPPEPAPAP